MCLLSVYPSNVQPVLQELLNGIETNNDGVGFTIATANGQLITEHAIGKAMNYEATFKDKNGVPKTYLATKIDPEPMEKLARRFTELRKRHPEGPAMFHSRMATGGAEDTRGCHPYKTGGDITGTVLAHNGVMFRVPQGDWRSDTRIFAEDVLPKRFRKFWRPAVRERLEKFLGTGNKVAIITVNPKFMTRTNGTPSRDPYELFIFNEEMGYWTEEGAWHSNGGFRSFTPAYRSYGTGRAGWDSYDNGVTWTGHSQDANVIGYAPGTTGAQARRDWNEATGTSHTCDFCSAIGSVDIYTEICEVCGTCNGCACAADLCECYTPRNATVPANIPAIEAGKVLPELTAETRAYYSLSPDEIRAGQLRRWWDEFENDPTLGDMKWDDYVTVRSYEEENDVDLMFDTPEQMEAWLAEQAAIAADKVVTESSVNPASLWQGEAAKVLGKGEVTPDPDDADGEPGIIRRLA